MDVKRFSLGVFVGCSLFSIACSGSQEDELGLADASANVDSGSADGGAGDGDGDAPPGDAGLDGSLGDGDQGDGDQGDGDLDAGDAGDGDTGGDGDGDTGGDGDGDGDGDTGAGPGFRITALTANGPVASASVLFHDVDGGVFFQTTTDASGVVSAAHAPAAVTLVNTVSGGPRDRYLVTYQGTEDGDDLVVRLALPYTEGVAGTRSFALTYPTAAPPAGANRYELRMGDDCWFDADPSTIPTSSVTPTDTCVLPTNALLAMTFDVDGAPVGFAYQRDVLPPASGETRSVSLQGWSSFDSLGVRTPNVSQDSTGVDLSVWMTANGAHFASIGARENDTSELLTGGALNFFVAPGFYSALDIKASSLAVPITGFMHVVEQLLRVADAEQEAALDMGLPRIESYDLEIEAEQANLSWTLSEPFVGADAQFVQYDWYQEIPNEDIGVNYYWTVVLPPSANALRFPPVVTSLGSALPDEAGPNVISSVDDSSLSGYREFKQRPLDLAGNPGSEQFLELPVNFELGGTAGSVRSTAILPPPI